MKHLMPSHDELAYSIATEGPEAFDDEIAIIAREAGERGLNPALIDVLVDPDVPAVMRQRAFGAVMRALMASDDEATTRMETARAA